jgi:hypothetical protein
VIALKLAIFVLVLAMLLVHCSALAIEKQAYQMREDLGTEPLYDCALQYYYYIPCPTYSWFRFYSGWNPGDILGAWFQVGDLSTGGWDVCSPVDCHVLDQIRVLDFAGYGTVHPGIFTVEFDVYCADAYGCPVGYSLWNSGPRETHFGWNYFPVDPPISICNCSVSPGPPPSGPRILVTATHTGYDGQYPAWGFDNISTPVENGCVMHDLGCLPGLYPRPYTSHYTSIHSGYYGQDFQYCPPQWIKDGEDTTPDASQFGFTEIAWRIYLSCTGPTDAQPTTWGEIKSMYGE